MVESDAGAGATQRFDQLDGLRALAFLCVFAFHFGLPVEPILAWGGVGYRIVPNLDLGVEIFFVLSGFLIFRPFAAANLDRARRPVVRDYAIRRILRIYPTYWVIFVALLVVSEVEMHGGLLHYTSHLGLVQQYFTDSRNDQADGIQQAWTLVVEVSFYALVPFLALALRRLRVRGHLVVLGLLTAFGYAMRAYTYADPVAGVLGRFLGLVPLALAALGPGMILAVLSLCDVPRLRRAAARTWMWWLAAAALFGVLMREAATNVAFSLRLGTSEAEIWHRMLSPAIAVCVVLPSVLAPTVRRGLVRRALSHRFAVWIGLVSYSAYLWHEPLITTIPGDHFGLDVADMAHKSIWYCLGMALVVLAATLALSFVTYLLVERPAMRLGRRLTRSRAPAERAFVARSGSALGT